MSSSIVSIIKDVGLRSMRVKYKEENSTLCQNCSDVSLAMSLPTSSGFIELKKHQITQKIKKKPFIKTCTKISNFYLYKRRLMTNI